MQAIDDWIFLGDDFVFCSLGFLESSNLSKLVKVKR